MKRYYLGIGALVLMIGTMTYAQDLSIYHGNKRIEMDVTPEMKQDTMYVPISFISKELGADVKWEKSKVIITKGQDQIICTIGDKAAYKNGNQVQLAHAPYLSNNRTFVPLRSTGELLDCNIDYIKQTNRINIIPNNSKGIDESFNMAYEKLEEHMKKLNALDYCVVGNWVYYAVLGPEEGFHKMLLDGTQDTHICDYSNVINGISGSTSITSEVEEGYILYKFQGLREYDENGQLCEDPHLVDYYRLDLFDNTLKPINK